MEYADFLGRLWRFQEAALQTAAGLGDRFPAERQETAGKMLQAIRKLEKLRDLRNHSVLAHGLRSVTREEVRETVQDYLPATCAGDRLEV